MKGLHLAGATVSRIKNKDTSLHTMTFIDNKASGISKIGVFRYDKSQVVSEVIVFLALRTHPRW